MHVRMYVCMYVCINVFAIHISANLWVHVCSLYTYQQINMCVITAQTSNAFCMLEPNRSCISPSSMRASHKQLPNTMRARSQ